MKIFPSRDLSDAEFVEKVRKQVLSARRQSWGALAFSLLHAGLVVFSWYFAIKHHVLQMGFVAGCFVGTFTGFGVMFAVYYFIIFIQHFFGSRRDKLLVAYYDRFYSLNADKTIPPASEKTSPVRVSLNLSKDKA
jgi:hypothetical protein